MHRQAVRVYHGHTGRVKCVAPVTGSVFLSGADDGSIRVYDARSSSGTQPLVPGQMENKTLLGGCTLGGRRYPDVEPCPASANVCEQHWLQQP